MTDHIINQQNSISKSGSDDPGLSLALGDTLKVEQDGSIAASGLSGFVAGVHSSTGGVSMSIEGAVSSGGRGIWVQAAGNNGYNSTINIAATGKITGQPFGIQFSNASGTIYNAGEIKSLDTQQAINLTSASSNHNLTVVNTGKIIGGTQPGSMLEDALNSNTAAIRAANGADTIVNMGYIQGKIVLGGGSDLYDGRDGQVIGVISLGSGTNRGYGGAGAEIFWFGNDNGMGHVNSTDYIDGGAGADTLVFNTREIDSIKINLSLTSAQNIGLFGTHTYRNIENITTGRGYDVLTGNAAANVFISGEGRDTLRGGSGKDKLYAQDENDLLYGDAGNDYLLGGLGNDVLYGGSGKDAFYFNTALSSTANKDTIKDWSAKDDTIRLENAVFAAFKKTGALSKSYFVLGSKAKDSNDFLGYNKTTGDLWYDANGSKAGGQVSFAYIGKNKIIDYQDFVIF